MKARYKNTTFWHNQPTQKKDAMVVPDYPPGMQLPNDPQNAREQAHRLYNLGAQTLNSGWAYTYSDDDDHPARVTLPELMQEYNQLPKYLAVNGRQTVENPLHALFVIKIALDHLDPKAIAVKFFQLKFAYANKSPDTSPINFPNGSGLFNDFALLQFLRVYILRNQKRFDFLSVADLGSVFDERNYILRSYIFMAGEDNTRWKAIDDLVSTDRLPPRNVLSPR